MPIKEFLLCLKKDKYKYPITIEYDFDNKQRNDINGDLDEDDALKWSLKYIDEIVS